MWFASNTYEAQAFKIVTYSLQLGYELGIDTFKTQWIFVATNFCHCFGKTCFSSVDLTNFAIFWKRNCLNHKRIKNWEGKKKKNPLLEHEIVNFNFESGDGDFWSSNREWLAQWW
jgi:hypothetical protein